MKHRVIGNVIKSRRIRCWLLITALSYLLWGCWWYFCEVLKQGLGTSALGAKCNPLDLCIWPSELSPNHIWIRAKAHWVQHPVLSVQADTCRKSASRTSGEQHSPHLAFRGIDPFRAGMGKHLEVWWYPEMPVCKGWLIGPTPQVWHHTHSFNGRQLLILSSWLCHQR